MTTDATIPWRAILCLVAAFALPPTTGVAEQKSCVSKEVSQPIAVTISEVFGWPCVVDREQRQQLCVPAGKQLTSFRLVPEMDHNTLGVKDIRKLDDRCVEARVSIHSADHTGANGAYMCTPAAFIGRIVATYCD
ncbi:MAG: hypothetical protein E6G97_24295 [Alphaproteobacteria bacterium]|nr:MAG: hypothetical protein E6G97_24295 [Alphaproteobacteria bacterium]